MGAAISKILQRLQVKQKVMILYKKKTVAKLGILKSGRMNVRHIRICYAFFKQRKSSLELPICYSTSKILTKLFKENVINTMNKNRKNYKIKQTNSWSSSLRVSRAPSPVTKYNQSLKH